MKNLNTIIMSGVMGLTLIAYSTAAYSDDHATYMLVQQSNLHPTKQDAFKESWNDLLKLVKEHNYKYKTYVSTSGPRVSMATELSSYADIDKVMEERKRVYDAGGRAFKRAVDGLDAATYSESSFVVKHMAEISNPPADEEMKNITMFDISEIKIKPGHSEKFEEIMAKYKTGLEKEGLTETERYNIYSGGVGASGTYFFQTFADNEMDMAEQDTKINAMFDSDKSMQDLYQTFLGIAQTGAYSNATEWKMAKSMAYFPASTE